METKNLGQWAKERLVLLAEEADKKLINYWEEEKSRDFGFNESQKELVKKMLEHGEEHNLRSAKRVRASFVYFSYLLGNKPLDEKIWRAVEAVELVHTALLMHDDFMDQDLVRRGKPTTQIYFGREDVHYGESMAVCLGDAILCLGFERLMETGFEMKEINATMKQMLRAIANTAYGQAYDASLSRLGEMVEEKVMSLHRAKTAIYTYENPLLIGAILGGLEVDIQKILSEYAMEGGVAFQLQDDILGIFGDEEKTGKSANSDLLQGKVTLLIVKVMEQGNEDQKKAVLKVWGKLKASDEEILRAKKAIKESGSYDYSVKIAKEYAQKAVEIARTLRNRNLSEEAIDYLEGIASYMVEREM